MARKYVNPSGPRLVTADQITSAQAELAQAKQELAEIAEGDVTARGWAGAYETAAIAERAAQRRLDTIEQLHAAQVERTGKRAATVKTAAPEVKAMAEALTASRDAVAEAAVAHLRALAALATAAEAHNALVDASRSRMAELGLSVLDSLTGQRHDSGTLGDQHFGSGLRIAGTDWTHVPAAGFTAHAIRQVFTGLPPRNPLHKVGQYWWGPSEVAERRDGLAVPTLESAKCTAPVPPELPQFRMASIRDLMSA